MPNLSTSTNGAPVIIAQRLWRDQATWVALADFFAVLTAIALPWSTSFVAIFVLCWLGSVAWIMDYRVYFKSLKHPMCFLPLALFVLAIVGTQWSDASWNERLYAIGPIAKLLVLPGLFYHFERSPRGAWVLVAFLSSCFLLMLVSWIVAFDPSLTLKAKGEEVCGILVRNSIDQGQEFTLCAVALVYPIVRSLKEKKWLLSAGLAAVALSFLMNMAFVVSSRTALLSIPVLCMIVALFCLDKRRAVLLTAIAVIISVAMAYSPRVCGTKPDTVRDFELYSTENIPTSAGLRLEFWKKSLQFIREAPVVGHGTGSVRGLFERASIGKVGAEGVVVKNPHNQTLNSAIQWGAAGVIVMYAMWLSHLLLFRGGAGLAACIGLLVVVQNIFGSLFNSNLFDFHGGWMYVLGVGIAGGMNFRSERERLPARLAPNVV